MDGSRYDVPQKVFWAREQERQVLARLATSLYPKDMKKHDTAAHRTRILTFWKEHGLAATRDAFSVSRPTLFRWKKELGEGLISSRSTAPKRRRSRHIPCGLESEICRIRAEHPRLGKEKLSPLLAVWSREHGLPVLSESTVGRIVRDMKRRGILSLPGSVKYSAVTGRLLEKKPRLQTPKLRRKGYLPGTPGDLLQIDGVTTFIDGTRRYTFTAVDLVSRWAFSRTYASASSKNGADFLRRLVAEAPFSIAHLQTDNGGEFLALFRDAAETLGITHFFNWVRQPKYQGWVERFNRSIQEEFLDWRRASLAGPTEAFNAGELTQWLAWYNGSRVHHAHSKGCQRLTPLQYLATAAQSHMY
jgi:putative transposase